MYYKRILKCDVFGIGEAVGGAAGAAGNIVAAKLASDSSRYAADRSYEGAVATNNAQIQIANDLNKTNIQLGKDTNKTNLEINERTNAANRALAAQQNQWNIEQWNRENEYNSPAHQVQLYRDAGLNPANLAGAGWSPAQPLQSADLANQQSVQLQAPQGTALPHLVNPASESSQIMAQGALASAQHISNAVSSAANAAQSYMSLKRQTVDISKAYQDIKESVARSRNLNINTDILSEQKSELVRQVYLQNKKLIADRNYVMAQLNTEKERTEYQKLLNAAQAKNNEILEKSAQYLIEKPRAEVESLLAGAFKAYADGRYTEFLHNYAKQHGRGLPSGTLDLVLNTLFDKLVGSDIDEIVKDPIKYGMGKLRGLLDKAKDAPRQFLSLAFDFLSSWAKGLFADH